jgi:hypothetical protein
MLMMCSIHIDEPTTGVNYYATVMSLSTFSGKLNSLYTPCTMHGSQSDTLKWVPQGQRDASYCDGVMP